MCILVFFTVLILILVFAVKIPIFPTNGGILSPRYPIAATSVTGYSGGSKAPQLIALAIARFEFRKMSLWRNTRFCEMSRHGLVNSLRFLIHECHLHRIVTVVFHGFDLSNYARSRLPTCSPSWRGFPAATWASGPGYNSRRQA